MAIRDILRLPDERLKQVSTQVERFDAALHAAIADLEETRLAGPAAVGIAAPQVGWFERVVIVDDVLSTGGTTRALVAAIRQMGGEVVGGIFLFNKLKGWKEWQDDIGFPLHPLFHVEVVGGRLVRQDWD